MAGYARTMMGGSGVPAGMAKAVNGGVQAALTATGTTQATALTITLGHADFTTVAANTGGVLSPGDPGDDVTVYNAGANALAVYPPSGAAFNALSNNTAVTCPVNTMMYFKCVSATKWRAMQSA